MDEKLVKSLGEDAYENLLEQIDQLCLVLDFMLMLLLEVTNKLKVLKQ